MDKRILFGSQKIRDLFFQNSLESFSFKTWKDLRELFKIPKSVFEFYKKGKLTLPKELYKKLSKKMQEKERGFFDRRIRNLDSNWGRIKAGKITYLKHKEIFDEGRKKAIESVRARVHKFDINIPLSSKLAYFIGLFIGDGFTNKYGRYYVIQFTGDVRNEIDFYSRFMKELCQELFNVEPIIKKDKYSNAIRFNIYSKDLFKMITERFEIPAGRKSRIVLIPSEIIESKPEIMKSCLRGLYDAEGCVFFDRRKTYKKPYPRIELHMCNENLLKQVYNFLTSLGINCFLGKVKDNLRVTIWGFEEVEKFIKEIGFSNPKYLNKFNNSKTT